MDGYWQQHDRAQELAAELANITAAQYLEARKRKAYDRSDWLRQRLIFLGCEVKTDEIVHPIQYFSPHTFQQSGDQ